MRNICEICVFVFIHIIGTAISDSIRISTFQVSASRLFNKLRPEIRKNIFLISGRRLLSNLILFKNIFFKIRIIPNNSNF